MEGIADGRRLCQAAERFSLRMFSNSGLEEMVSDSLDATGRWHQRLRALSASLMVLFVLLLVLRRESSIPGVFQSLVRLLRDRGKDPRLPLKPVTDEAVHKARGRLGHEPLLELFRRTADTIDPLPSLNGLCVWAGDGVTFTVPDTKANDEQFRRPGASKGKAAFPQMKMVALLSTDEHLVRDAVLGHGHLAERPAILELAKRHLGRDDLLILDRGFAAGYLFETLVDIGTNFLVRIPASWKSKRTKRLGRGDWLIVIDRRESIPEEQRVDGGPKTRRLRIALRMIEFKTKTTKVVRLVTNLFSPKDFPALDVALAYHERWEIESAYDELKTHMLSVRHGTLHTVFRSKSPDGCLQEAYATLAAYNLIRELMSEAALKANLQPLALSFVGALRTIQDALPRFAAANGAKLELLAELLLEDLAACRIDRPRRGRANPRKVKVKMSSWQVKRESDRGTQRDFEKEIKLLNARSWRKEAA